MLVKIYKYELVAEWNNGQEGWDVRLPGRRFIVNGRGLGPDSGEGRLKAALKSIPSFNLADTFKANQEAALRERAEAWMADPANWTSPVHMDNLTCEFRDLSEEAQDAWALLSVAEVGL